MYILNKRLLTFAAGPGEPYEVFAGRDCSRALALMNLRSPPVNSHTSLCSSSSLTRTVLTQYYRSHRTRHIWMIYLKKPWASWTSGGTSMLKSMPVRTSAYTHRHKRISPYTFTCPWFHLGILCDLNLAISKHIRYEVVGRLISKNFPVPSLGTPGVGKETNSSKCKEDSTDDGGSS